MMDGEGTIGLFKHPEAFEKLRPHFLVTNNSLELMKWLQEHFGGKTKRHDRSAWRWGVWSVKDVLKLTEAVRPYLIIKGEKANIVQEYCVRNLMAHSHEA